MGNADGSTPAIIADAGAASGFIGVYKTRDDRQHARVPTGVVKDSPPRGRQRPARVPNRIQRRNGLLPVNAFAQTIQRELRRCERSAAPLSMVRYRIGAGIESPQFDRVLAIIQGSMRETDVLGLVSGDTLAILCPDTDAAGAQRLIEKFAPLVHELDVAPTAMTFPDQVFASLSKGTSPDDALQLFSASASEVDHHGQYRLKRTLDILLVLIALPLFAPLMLVVALLVRWTSPGPVIFRQIRLGKGGVPFTFYKFRSMTADGDDRIHREYMARLIRGSHDGADQGQAKGSGSGTYKMTADPRVTRIGKVIRMTSIDELPQLFNVLKGDMSMVGPRPPIPYEAAHYDPWQLRRVLTAKPGITGQWQVEGRSRVSFSEMVRMDLRYIRRCSLMLDLKILAKTVAVVLRCSGAR